MDELLAALGGKNGAAIGQLAQQFGISPDQAEGAVRGLAPSLTGAISKNTAQPGGLESLFGALQKGGHDRYVENPTALAEEGTTEDGNAILGHLLGSKDESRQVASAAAVSSGLDAGMLKKMLPLVATLLMGSLGGKAKQSGALGGGGGAGGMGGLASILQGMGAGGGLGDMLGGAMGGGASSGSSSSGGGLGALLGKFLGKR
jgi:hypothetical protein